MGRQGEPGPLAWALSTGLACESCEALRSDLSPHPRSRERLGSLGFLDIGLRGPRHFWEPGE